MDVPESMPPELNDTLSIRNYDGMFDDDEALIPERILSCSSQFLAFFIKVHLK